LVTVATVAAALFGGLQVWMSRRGQKVLACTALSAGPLLAQRATASRSQKVELLVDGQPIDGTHVTTVAVRIWNAGTRVIDDTDFKTPLHLSFGRHARLVTEGTVQSEPPGAHTVVTRNPDNPAALVVQPMLFNKKDEITVHVLVMRYDTVELQARITDGEVRNMPKGRPMDGGWRWARRGMECAFVGSLMLLFAAITTSTLHLVLEWVTIGCLSASVIFLAVAVVQGRRELSQ
jgi:hypothetical protein